MKTVFLLRHAKSSWDDPGLADHERPLSARGRLSGRRLATYVDHAGIRPGLALCSTATRARQTLDAIAPFLGPSLDVCYEERLYGADAADLLARLRLVPDEVGQVLLVGHNPGLHDLANAIAGDGDDTARRRLRDKLPTGALAVLTTGSSWAGLGPGTALLESLVLPRHLPG